MKKARPVIMSIAVAAMLLIPLAASALTASYTTLFGGSAPGGTAYTVDGRAYLTVQIQTYIDGVPVAYAGSPTNWMPNPGGQLIAQASNPTAPTGTHVLEARGYHMASELPNGLGYDYYQSYKSGSYTKSSRSATFTQSGAVSAQMLQAVTEKVRAAHADVASAIGINSRQYDYYSYQDCMEISDGSAFADRDLAGSFLEAAIGIETNQLVGAAVGVGYWISDDGMEAIVGTKMKDGSVSAFRISAISTEAGYEWTSPVSLTR